MDVIEIDSLEKLKGYFSSHKKSYVYGAGEKGRELLKSLKDFGIRISSFLVTEKETDDVEGVPVQEAKEIDVSDAPSIFIAVWSETEREKIITGLAENFIADCAVGTRRFWMEIRKRNLDIEAKNYIDSFEGNTGRFKIGYLWPGYATASYTEKRLIVDRLNSDLEIADKVCYVKIPKEIEGVDERQGGHYDSYYKPKLYVPKADVIHTINTVCITKLKWCSSFETTLPRGLKGKETVRQFSEYIGKDNCIGIFPMSDCACRIEENFLKQNLDNRLFETVMDKVQTMHPPQPILVTEAEMEDKCNKRLDEITFILIASQFFMKGGREIIRALKRFEGKYKFRLKIMGGIGANDYFVNQSKEETKRYKRIIEQTPWIEHLGRIPNEQVLQECIKADIGLLPSFGDTYGFSVLEMQAAGNPVITSNIRAFPEINNDKCGYICNLPVNEFGFCMDVDRDELSHILEEELVLKFEEIFSRPKEIKEKRLASVARIRRMHDPVQYADRLWKIYNGQGTGTANV